MLKIYSCLLLILLFSFVGCSSGTYVGNGLSKKHHQFKDESSLVCDQADHSEKMDGESDRKCPKAK